ncbi:unnamed protein product [Urochloa humidicola]
MLRHAHPPRTPTRDVRQSIRRQPPWCARPLPPSAPLLIPRRAPPRPPPSPTPTLAPPPPHQTAWPPPRATAPTTPDAVPRHHHMADDAAAVAGAAAGPCSSSTRRQQHLDDDAGACHQRQPDVIMLRRTRSGRAFPPPISVIGKGGRPWLSLRAHREGGRLVLREMRLPSQELLQPCKEDGRFKLLIHTAEGAGGRGTAGAASREGSQECY